MQHHIDNVGGAPVLPIVRNFDLQGLQSFPKTRAAATRCHVGIGRATVHTPMAISPRLLDPKVPGLVPTVYCGLRACAVMTVARFADLTLLPALLATGRAFDPAAPASRELKWANQCQR
jgi:hypothetical protein